MELLFCSQMLLGAHASVLNFGRGVNSSARILGKLNMNRQAINV